ncbi:MAG: DNA-3-methyladenine glycosylase [Bdellovibrionales bacterium]|nr:DNA-3-methyladenine glycosylase [Bdellovibrionales bacterium]
MLKPSFFQRDTITVARELLGKILVRKIDGQLLTGMIVETEAYLGFEDPSCHSFHGKITERTQAFYRPGGYIYVYKIYGIHHCLNFITADEKTPEAVLIRALQPLSGIETMKLFRNAKNEIDLCNGPGKLAQAFHIDKKDNNQLIGSGLGVQDRPNVSQRDIVDRPRVGLNPYCDSSHWPIRYYLKGNAYISRP